MDNYFVYIIRCEKDKTLYTGICKNIEKRMKQHSTNKGAKYTRGRGPFTLLIFWKFDNKSEVSKEEYRIKKLSRKEKNYLISV